MPVINTVAARFIQAGAARMMAVPPDYPRAFSDITVAPAPLAIPTRHGEVNSTVHRPSEDHERPAIYVNFHGGGYVIGMPEQDDLYCAFLAQTAGVVVVNVDYAIAPQARFPVAIEQGTDILNWLVEHAAEHGWDATRIVLGGQSAGAAIATALARIARDAGSPAIALEVLNYPPIDLVTQAKDKPHPTAKPLLTPAMAHIFDGAYAAPALRSHPHISPAATQNLTPKNGKHPLAGMPRTVVVTAEQDILREEGARYAEELRAAGVEVAYLDVPGVDHAFFGAGPAATARDAMTFVADEVTRALR
jgi:acetyl esterase